uniref:Putative peptidase n=1 Tax=viral metagenome TaxID=1070528 RepID=A0A6M3KC85_9ZZZZ
MKHNLANERRRVIFPSAEMRAAEQDGKRFIEGMASTFDREYPVADWFIEVFRAGAFTKTLQENQDMFVLYQHDDAQVLGSRRSKTAEIWVDAEGLHYRAAMPNTSYAADAWEVIRRGDINGSSILFEAVKDRWTRNYQGDLSLREVLEAKLWEVSPVTFPANPATSSSARAIIMPADARAIMEANEIPTAESTEESDAAAHSLAARRLESERLRVSFAQIDLKLRRFGQ